MDVCLLAMAAADFAAFWNISLSHHAQELVEEEGYDKEEAVREAERELSSMLPQGADTPHQYFMPSGRGTGKWAISGF